MAERTEEEVGPVGPIHVIEEEALDLAAQIDLLVAAFRRQTDEQAVRVHAAERENESLRSRLNDCAQVLGEAMAERVLRDTWGVLLDDPKSGVAVRATYTVKNFFAPFVYEYGPVDGEEQAKVLMRQQRARAEKSGVPDGAISRSRDR